MCGVFASILKKCKKLRQKHHVLKGASSDLCSIKALKKYNNHP